MQRRITVDMNSFCLMFLLLIQIFFCVYSLIDSNLIECYLQEKSIKHVALLGCFKKTERLHLAKTVMFKWRHASVLDLNQKLKISHQSIGIVLDGDCPKSEQFLVNCGLLNFFDVKHHWLILTASTSIVKKFEKVISNINSDIYIATKKTPKNWAITEIYNPAFEYGGVLNFTTIGYYRDGLGCNLFRNTGSKFSKRRNMTGVTLKTMVLIIDPFVGPLDRHLRDDDDRHLNTFPRFQNKLLRFCRDYYNFTMISEVGKSFGYPYPNGSFDGLVGALERKSIAFGSTPMFLRVDRSKVIDYGRNTWRFRAGFLFRSPKSQTPLEIFFTPLSPSVWLVTVFLALISIAILKLVTSYDNENLEASWSFSVMFTLGAFCQQGSPRVPEMICGRMTAISLFLMSLVIYQFYSASIVSHLLMKPSGKIKTLRDLLESSLQVGAEDVIYNRDAFEHATDKVLTDLYRKKIHGKENNTPHFLTPEKGLSLVKRGGYAFHTEVAKVYPLIEKTFSDKAICELREVKLFRNTDLYSVYQKDSPFYDMLETCFQKIAECGILFRELRFWHPRKPECLQTDTREFHVALDEFYPALLILLLGVVLSLIVLVVERRIALVKERGKENLIFPFVQ